MQYISTEYYGPTNTKPSKIIAKASGGSKCTVSYNHEWSSERNHNEAAKTLAVELNWHGKWVAGHGDTGNVYVLLPYEGEQESGFIIAR